jgi:hypothetical protein
MSVRKDARFPRRRQNGSSDVLGLSETKIRLANASTVTCAITLMEEPMPFTGQAP